jgi:hypothetical protein
MPKLRADMAADAGREAALPGMFTEPEEQAGPLHERNAARSRVCFPLSQLRIVGSY